MILHVRDEKGAARMAALIVRDKLNRLYPNPSIRLTPGVFFQPRLPR
jgi:hypothetical protein